MQGRTSNSDGAPPQIKDSFTEEVLEARQADLARDGWCHARVSTWPASPALVAQHNTIH